MEKWSLESNRSSSSVLRVSSWERPNFSQPQTFAQPWYGSHNFEATSVLQMVLDLGDRLLIQPKANEIRNSSNANAELRRGRCVEGITGVIHPSQARTKRNRQSSALFPGTLVALGEWSSSEVREYPSLCKMFVFSVPLPLLIVSPLTALSAVIAHTQFQMSLEGHYYLG